MKETKQTDHQTDYNLIGFISTRRINENCSGFNVKYSAAQVFVSLRPDLTGRLSENRRLQKVTVESKRRRTDHTLTHK